MTRFVRCRAFGHQWEPIEATRKPLFGFYAKLRCVDCGAERNDIVSRRGDLLSRSYTYPEGYRNMVGTRADHRLSIIRDRARGGTS